MSSITLDSPNSYGLVAFPIEANKDAENWWGKKVTDYIEKNGNDYRLASWAKDFVQLVDMVAQRYFEQADTYFVTAMATTKELAGAVAWAAGARWLQLTIEMPETLRTWMNDAHKALRFDVKTLGTLTEWMVMGCYTAAQFLRDKSYIAYAPVPAFIHEMCNAELAISDLLHHRAQMQNINAAAYTGKTKEILDNTQIYLVLSAVKPVLGAIAALGAIFAAGCVAVETAVVLTVLSGVAGNTTAIAAHFFKASCPDKLIDYGKL